MLIARIGYHHRRGSLASVNCIDNEQSLVLFSALGYWFSASFKGGGDVTIKDDMT